MLNVLIYWVKSRQKNLLGFLNLVRRVLLLIFKYAYYEHSKWHRRECGDKSKMADWRHRQGPSSLFNVVSTCLFVVIFSSSNHGPREEQSFPLHNSPIIAQWFIRILTNSNYTAVFMRIEFSFANPPIFTLDVTPFCWLSRPSEIF